MKKIEAMQMEMIVGGDANSFWQGVAVAGSTVAGAGAGAIAGVALIPFMGPAGPVVGGALGALGGLSAAILAL